MNEAYFSEITRRKAPELGAPILSPGSPDRAESRMARFFLILVATAVTWPSSFSHYFSGSASPHPWPILGISGVWLGLTMWLSGRRPSEQAPTLRNESVLLFLDVVCLTALLSLSGAAQHPFSMLYFVPITLTTVVLPNRTWQVALLSVGGFAILLAQTISVLAPHRIHPAHAHFLHHVTGMAVALAVVGAFVTYAVHRIAMRLFEQRERVHALARERTEDRFAVALGALAAGAAHELGTPLCSVQLLAEDLAFMDADGRCRATETILSEVQRMKKILHGLGSSELSAEVLSDRSTWSLTQLRNEIEPAGIQLAINGNDTTSQPHSILIQMVRELVRNATKVAEPGGIEVRVDDSDSNIRITVSDNGPGVTDADATRLFRPFVSETGGTGLGLFLASVHARQLGGDLRLQNTEGPGATFVLTLPRYPDPITLPNSS